MRRESAGGHELPLDIGDVHDADADHVLFLAEEVEARLVAGERALERQEASADGTA